MCYDLIDQIIERKKRKDMGLGIESREREREHGKR